MVYYNNVRQREKQTDLTSTVIRVLDNIKEYNMKNLIYLILLILGFIAICCIESPQDYHLPLEAGQNYKYLYE